MVIDEKRSLGCGFYVVKRKQKNGWLERDPSRGESFEINKLEIDLRWTFNFSR